MEFGLSDSYFHIRHTMDLRSYSSAFTGLPFQVSVIVCNLTMEYTVIARLLKAQVASPEASQIHSPHTHLPHRTYAT